MLNGKKEHCPKGHPYDEKNTRLQPKKSGIVSRHCRACENAARRAYHQKRKSHGFDEQAKTVFWAKVEIGAADECWLWTGQLVDTGYGRFRYKGRQITASRFALGLSLGRMLNKSEFACHHCDNPPCCNPAHLFAGTPKDNAVDARQKGRVPIWMGAHRGTGNPRAKLDDEKVKLIRQSQLPDSILAEQFGVSPSTIYDVRRGRRWSVKP